MAEAYVEIRLPADIIEQLSRIAEEQNEHLFGGLTMLNLPDDLRNKLDEYINDAILELCDIIDGELEEDVIDADWHYILYCIGPDGKRNKIYAYVDASKGAAIAYVVND